jgi:hypothetical protein
LIVSLAITLIVACAVLVSGAAHANDRTTHFAVTITNITRGQIISPPIVISHNGHFELFSLGEPATPGLAALAEDADTSVLKDELDASSSVYDYDQAGGVIEPGLSVTVEINTKQGFQRISAAGMLVTTNDAFFAVRDVYARYWGNTVNYARAYDAGSEVNTELCASIPGPPCGNGGVRVTDGAEGYVYVHSGIHGNGDLAAADFDWQNPVATIKIQRVK